MKLKSVLFKFPVVERIRRLPGSWQSSDFRRILSLLEVDGIDSYSEADLEEVAVMALQDLGVRDAAEFVLTHFTGDHFSAGQIQNLCDELKERCSWDEYADLVDHRAIYVAVDLLHTVFPNEYPQPSLCRIRFEMESEQLGAALADQPLTAAIVLRANAKCQNQSSVLNRLFDEQIAGAPFPEADLIVWQMSYERSVPATMSIELYGSSYWFKDIIRGFQKR